MHSLHPPITTHGLNDECLRCIQHSEHPFESLDDENLKMHIWRIQKRKTPRSDAEANAMKEIGVAMRKAERIQKLLPQISDYNNYEPEKVHD